MKTGRVEDGTGKRENQSSSLLVFFSSSLLLVFLSSACGKKGPPLAPLNMAPAAPQSVTARRLADTVYVQLTVPDRGMSGRGPFSIDHLTVYAITVAPGSPTPPNRELLKPEHAIAEIAVQPPPDPDAAEPETADSRPRPGDAITFVEKLTAAQLTPAVVKPEPATKAAKPARGALPPPPAAAAGAPAVPVGPQVLTRVYVVEGVPKKGRGAAPSARVEVPLLEAPGAPRPGTPSASETSVTVTWQPPPSTTDEAPGVLYNVYKDTKDAKDTKDTKEPAPVPLNDKPLAEQTFTHAGAEPGKEQCFVVRSVAPVGIESAPSDPICITPKDTYPPAAPKSVAAVSSAGVINLIWDANQEGDLGGYIVLRGDAGGDRLQELFRDPLKETRYADRTVTAGTRYVYAVVAVDKAGNRSALSNRVEEAAR